MKIKANTVRQRIQIIQLEDIDKKIVEINSIIIQINKRKESKLEIQEYAFPHIKQNVNFDKANAKVKGS